MSLTPIGTPKPLVLLLSRPLESAEMKALVRFYSHVTPMSEFVVNRSLLSYTADDALLVDITTSTGRGWVQSNFNSFEGQKVVWIHSAGQKMGMGDAGPYSCKTFNTDAMSRDALEVSMLCRAHPLKVKSRASRFFVWLVGLLCAASKQSS